MEQLKSRARITSGDERNENLSFGFDKLYNDVASVRLHPEVPEKVQSYFASIQNLCLYGWFIYSFYALTEFLTYTCIEMALREKFKRKTLNEHGPLKSS